MRLIVFLTILIGCNTVLAETNFDKLMPSIVSVLPVWSTGNGNLEEPEGSGFVIGDGNEILTTAHVLSGSSSLNIRSYSGEIIGATILWIDKETDIALLAIGKKLPAVKIYPVSEIGSPVCAIGNSFGLGISMSCGVISALERTGIGFNLIEDFIQTDAAVNPGKSGGVLVDKKGQVVGMLSAIFTKKSDANIGVNFAVSSRLLNLAIQNRQIENFSWRKTPLALLSHPPKGETGPAGANIVNFRSKSDTEYYGLKTGDIIIKAGNRNITKPSDFRTEFAMFEGEELPITVLRDNKKVQIIWHFNNQR